MNIEQILN